MLKYLSSTLAIVAGNWRSGISGEVATARKEFRAPDEQGLFAAITTTALSHSQVRSAVENSLRTSSLAELLSVGGKRIALGLQKTRCDSTILLPYAADDIKGNANLELRLK